MDLSSPDLPHLRVKGSPYTLRTHMLPAKREPTNVTIGCCGGSSRKAKASRCIQRRTSVSLPTASTVFRGNCWGIIRRKNCLMRRKIASMPPEYPRRSAARRFAAVAFLRSWLRPSLRKATAHYRGLCFFKIIAVCYCNLRIFYYFITSDNSLPANCIVCCTALLFS